MSESKAAKGARGEEIAAAFLSNLGYEILHRNLRLNRIETDIICRDGDCLVFVEVKCSPAGSFGHPATWIDQKKQDRLRQAALAYIEQFNIEKTDIRFDAVTIDRGKLEHYKNAF